MIYLISNIWNLFYLDGPETNTEKKLEIIRTVIKRSDVENVELFNYWARKVNVQEIKLLR